MKKNLIIISSIFIVALSSCKKDYSCTCTTKLSQPGLLPYQTATAVNIDKKNSHKKAEKICKNTAKQMQANTTLLFDSSTKVESNCSLQEK